jgi:hypothetical protein
MVFDTSVDYDRAEYEWVLERLREPAQRTGPSISKTPWQKSLVSGPTGFLRWVVENRFSLDPLVAKHEKVICDMGPYDVYYCYTKGLQGWSGLVKTAVGNLPTFSSMYNPA